MYYTTFSIPQILISVTTAPVTLTQQDVKITKAVTSVLYNIFYSSDIDECDNNPCDLDTTRCENNEGSYKCICLDGYQATTDAHVCDGKFLGN